MSSDAAVRPASAVSSEASILDRWPALLALVLGLVVVYGVGFTTFPIAHNAAHDARHANGFPCH
jgi:cobalt transporter subunit CbtB